MKKTADQVIVVGIGSKRKIDKNELELIASNTKLVFMVNDFKLLGGQLKAITQQTCRAAYGARYLN